MSQYFFWNKIISRVSIDQNLPQYNHFSFPSHYLKCNDAIIRYPIQTRVYRNRSIRPATNSWRECDKRTITLRKPSDTVSESRLNKSTEGTRNSLENIPRYYFSQF